jgi:hypothetical protein
MIDSAQLWPLQPFDMMTPDQQQRWFEKCYMRSSVDDLLADPQRSTVVVTTPGCGISTSLALLMSQGLLTFPYGLDQWPGEQHAFTYAPDHFSQMMAHVAHVFIERFKASPGQLTQCSPLTHEFLAWMVRRYLGARQGQLWLRFLEQQTNEQLQQAIERVRASTGQELYTNDTVGDIYSQIDECLDLARTLGWEGIYAVVDIPIMNWIERTPDKRLDLLDKAKRLLTSLTPLQRPGFGFKIGVSANLLSVQDAQVLLRNRATITTFAWKEHELRAIMQRCLSLSAYQSISLDTLLPHNWWDLTQEDMRSIWGVPGPSGILALLQEALEQYNVAPQVVADARWFTIRQNLYRHYAPLRCNPDDEERVVWRGTIAIPLDEQQWRLFTTVWKHHGSFVSNEALLDIAGSRANLDQIVSRVRQAIEPMMKSRTYLYLFRTTSNGTWLDRQMCRFG